MPAPKNNKNALGNCGGGRKSAFEEIKAAEWLKTAWGDDFDVSSLQKKVESGTYSVRDIFLLNALNGQPAALKVMADKILPARDEMKDKREQEVWQPPIIVDPSGEPFALGKRGY